MFNKDPMATLNNILGQGTTQDDILQEVFTADEKRKRFEQNLEKVKRIEDIISTQLDALASLQFTAQDSYPALIDSMTKLRELSRSYQ